VAEDEIDDIRVIATYVAGKKVAADAHQPFE
jgi:hypothetical protein